MTYKERRFVCCGCGADIKALLWNDQWPDPCPCGRPWQETALALSRNRGVIDDQIEGGPRWFETFGHEPVWIESKSQWMREVDKRKDTIQWVGDKHDAAYYAKRRKMHDEELADTGTYRDA